MLKSNERNWAIGRCLVAAAFVAIGGATAGCSDAQKADSKNAAATTMTKAKEVAGDVAVKGKELASAAADGATDTWITAKVKAKIADEKAFNGIDIAIATADHVVTLSGAVPSAELQAHAVDIAQGTERVTRVVNNLVVRKG